MSESILIKGNQDGLTLFIKEDYPFETVIADLNKKLTVSAGFFGENAIALSIVGRELTEQQEALVIEQFHQCTDLRIAYIISKEGDLERVRQELRQEMEQELADRLKQSLTETIKKELYQEYEANMQAIQKQLIEKSSVQSLDSKRPAVFHYATLRSGQELSYQEDIVVLGDVNNGARIESGGNVIILGKLKGVVHAGQSSKQNGYVIALQMEPVQLKIHDSYGKASNINMLLTKEAKPQVAFVENGMIVIEDIDNKIFREIKGID